MYCTLHLPVLSEIQKKDIMEIIVVAIWLYALRSPYLYLRHYLQLTENFSLYLFDKYFIRLLLGK